MAVNTDETTRLLFDALADARRTLDRCSYLERDLRITRVWREVRRFAPDIADALAEELRAIEGRHADPQEP